MDQVEMDIHADQTADNGGVGCEASHEPRTQPTTAYSTNDTIGGLIGPSLIEIAILPPFRFIQFNTVQAQQTAGEILDGVRSSDCQSQVKSGVANTIPVPIASLRSSYGQRIYQADEASLRGESPQQILQADCLFQSLPAPATIQERVSGVISDATNIEGIFTKSSPLDDAAPDISDFFKIEDIADAINNNTLEVGQVGHITPVEREDGNFELQSMSSITINGRPVVISAMEYQNLRMSEALAKNSQEIDNGVINVDNVTVDVSSPVAGTSVNNVQVLEAVNRPLDGPMIMDNFEFSKDFMNLIETIIGDNIGDYIEAYRKIASALFYYLFTDKEIDTQFFAKPPQFSRAKLSAISRFLQYIEPVLMRNKPLCEVKFNGKADNVKNSLLYIFVKDFIEVKVFKEGRCHRSKKKHLKNTTGRDGHDMDAIIDIGSGLTMKRGQFIDCFYESKRENKIKICLSATFNGSAIPNEQISHLQKLITYLSDYQRDPYEFSADQLDEVASDEGIKQMIQRCAKKRRAQEQDYN